MTTKNTVIQRVTLLAFITIAMFVASCDYSIVEGGRETTGDIGDNDTTSNTQIIITITPLSVTLTPGATQQFAATVTGSTNTGVSWSLISGPGTLSQTGLYTAPASIASRQHAVVQATAQANPAKTTRATITINDPNLVCFERDVMPIFASNCTMSGCHSGPKPEKDLDFTTYEGILAGFDDDGGNEGKNQILKKITESDPNDVMPPPPMEPLTAAQIETIRKWIDQGAKNEDCSETGDCDTLSVSYANMVRPLIQNMCLGCHNGANVGNRNVNLATYEGVRTVAQSGRLFGALSHSAGYVPMPMNLPKLDDCTLAKIRSWIRDGALNN